MLDVQDRFRDHCKIAFEKQVVNTNDGTRERVFDWREESIGVAIGNCREGGIESGARNGGDRFAEELNSSSFTERTAFALECDARGF